MISELVTCLRPEHPSSRTAPSLADCAIRSLGSIAAAAHSLSRLSDAVIIWRQGPRDRAIYAPVRIPSRS